MVPALLAFLAILQGCSRREPSKAKAKLEIKAGITNPPVPPCDTWLRQAINTPGGTAARLDAVANLARHCREHRVFQNLRWIIGHENDDVAVRIAIVRALPNWEELSMATPVIVEALSMPAPRAAAIETLESMGPAQGEKETRLLRQVGSMQAGQARLRTMSILGKLYGRDHRVLDFLRNELRNGNRWERSMAASELCGLGEVDASLAAARDSEPLVRKSIAAALGRCREGGGSGEAEVMQASRSVWH